MEERYKIFKNGFNKILDLLSSVDDEIELNYKKLVSIIPSNVVGAVSECDDFSTHNDKYYVDFMRLVNAVSLDYINKKPHLRTEIYIHRLFEEDLSPKKLFSLTVRNTPIKKPSIRLFYEEKDGKFNFVRTGDRPNEKSIDISWEVYLDYEDFEPYLVYKKFFRGLEIVSKKIDITFDELTQYIEDIEDYEEDMEVEFDADFDL
jgi:hypothetical protein